MTEDPRIEKLRTTIKEAMANEWIAQGHDLTGTFIREIDIKTQQLVDGISLEAWVLKYGAYLETGVSASRIPYSGPGGGGRSFYIQSLIRYARQRMNIRSLSEAKSVAFAIANTHKKTGMPTPASKRFSSTGKRTDWLAEALSKNEDRIARAIREWAGAMMKVNLDNFISRWNTKLNKKL